MSKKHKNRTRDTPVSRSTSAQTALVTPDAWKLFLADGYTPLWQCPEVGMCVDAIADAVSSMTVKLMANTEKGDRRVRNGLSRRIDINPNPLYTRKLFFHHIVKTMLTTGDGNCVVVPEYGRDGHLLRLTPLRPSQTTFRDTPDGYEIHSGGAVFRPDEVLHFRMNPDTERPYIGTGTRITLRNAVECIRQANRTKKALQSSPVPSLLVKVDGLTEDLQDKDGRKKLLNRYVDATENGQPWIVAAETMEITTVKPLTLADLAVKDNLELDKKTVAGIFRVPPFMVGVGTYDKEAYKHFITVVVMGIAQYIQQELTAKLLWSEDMYFCFNPRSLYNYDITELVNGGKELLDRMAMRRNEMRDWIGLEWDEEMEELLGLENYIPVTKLGDQKKLNGGDSE